MLGPERQYGPSMGTGIEQHSSLDKWIDSARRRCRGTIGAIYHVLFLAVCAAFPS